MDTEIVRLFTEIKEDLGGLKQAMDLHNQAFAAHILSDQMMAQDVTQLKLEAAKANGAHRAWEKILNGLIGVAGAVGGFLGAKHLG